MRKPLFCRTFAATLIICLFGFPNSIAAHQGTLNESFHTHTSQQYGNGITGVTCGNDTVRVQVVMENPWLSKYNASFNSSLLGDSDWEYDWRPFVQHFRKVDSFSSHNPNGESGMNLSAGMENRLSGFVNKFFTTKNWLKSAELLNESKEIVHKNSNFVSSVIGISNLELPLSSKTEIHNPFAGLSAEGRVKVSQNIAKLPDLHNESLSNASAGANKPESPFDSESPELEFERFSQVQSAEDEDSSKLKDVQLVTVLPTTIGRIISLLDEEDVAKFPSINGQLTIASEASSLKSEGNLFPSLLISEEGFMHALESDSKTDDESATQMQVIADQGRFASNGAEFRNTWESYPYTDPNPVGMNPANPESRLDSVSILNRNASTLPVSSDSPGPVDGSGKNSSHPFVQTFNYSHGPKSESLNQPGRKFVREHFQQILEFHKSEIQSQYQAGFADDNFIVNRNFPFLLQYLKNARESIPIPYDSRNEPLSDFSQEYWNNFNYRIPYNEYTQDLADTITIEH